MGRKKKIANIEIQLDPAEVGKRAYEKWLKRGCIEGYAQQDWVEAEIELRAEKAACVVEFKVHESKEKELILGFKVEEKLGKSEVDPSLQEHSNFPSGNGLDG